MDLQHQIEYILKARPRVPVRAEITIPVDAGPVDHAPANHIEVTDVLNELLTQRAAIGKENEELRYALLWAIENHSQFEWNREIKREFLRRFFPNQIRVLPYHAGGDA